MTTHTHQNDPARTAGETVLADWREAVAKEIAALEASDAAPGDADLQLAYKAAVERSRSVARQAWTRLSEPADVLVRAEIARHCLWPRYHGERRFEAVIMDKEFDDGLELAAFDERAVAELASAAMWAGCGANAAAGGHRAPAPGDRPQMPQLADHELKDIYEFAGDAETSAQCLRHTLNSVFHEYRLRAHDWDVARGLLSPEQLENGADAETESRREQARARARRQMAPASDDADHAGGLLLELEEMLCKARQGVTALRTVMKGWESEHGPGRPFYEGEASLLASFAFCADGVEATLNLASDRIDDAIEGQSPPS